MQLADVTLAVRDLERAVRFYEQAIGLERIEDLGVMATLGAGGVPMLRLVERPHATPRGSAAGLFHVAWLLADRAHLGAALLRLDAAGVPLTGAADHHVSEAVYLDDPDGHGIELYADRPRAHWRRDGTLVMQNSRLDLGGLRRAAVGAGLPAAASSRGARLGHVHLEAVDLAAAGAFAREQLGLELEVAWPNALFLAWDGYHHHLAYNDWNRRRLPLDPAGEAIGLVEIGLSGGPAGHATDPNGIPFVTREPATATLHA
jgi:catechol 2,3-dioxygenase